MPRHRNRRALNVNGRFAALGPEPDLTICGACITLRRARLALAMTTPGHRVLIRRQRRALPAWFEGVIIDRKFSRRTLDRCAGC